MTFDSNKHTHAQTKTINMSHWGDSKKISKLYVSYIIKYIILT